MDKLREKQTAFNFKMKCLKIGLVLLSTIFLITSLFVISGGTTLQILFGDHYHILQYAHWYTTKPESLSGLYIATGCLLLVASVFGIVAVLKESTCMTNFYGVFLSLIFILQMAAAITGFTLAAQANYVWIDVLNNLLSTYLNDGSTLDWIQRTFRCCGNDSPDDWKYFAGFNEYYENYNGVTDSNRSIPRLPQSCCEYDHEWEPTYKICGSFFTRGCNDPLSAVLTESMMMIATSALVIGFLQVLAIVFAFIYAKTIRGNKTTRDLHRWTLISQSMGLDRPSYTNQIPSA